MSCAHDRMPETPVLGAGAPLTRFQQVLLGTDGTVTTILEAYAEEPMEVVKLLQVVEAPNDGDAALLLAGDPSDRVLRRRVLLRGQRSGRTFLYAEAVVVVDRVHPAVLEGLLRTDKPIGALLAENRTETFREILEVGREVAGPYGAHFGVDPAAEAIFRTYRILSGGWPVMLITERFPSGSFLGLPA